MKTAAAASGVAAVASADSVWAQPTTSTVPMVTLDELLSRSDIVSLHLGLNDETRGFLGRSRLKKLSIERVCHDCS